MLNYVVAHGLIRENRVDYILQKMVFYTLLVFFVVFFTTNISRVYANDLAENFDLVDTKLSLILSNHKIKTYQSNANIIQNGVFNQAVINQNAQNSDSNIEQYGSNNYAEVTQYGYGNDADIKQFGTNNIADVVQDGIGNTATVIQYGQQQFYLLQRGNHESLTITQY